MKQKTRIMFWAFSCGSLYASLVHAVRNTDNWVLTACVSAAFSLFNAYREG